MKSAVETIPYIGRTTSRYTCPYCPYTTADPKGDGIFHLVIDHHLSFATAMRTKAFTP